MRAETRHGLILEALAAAPRVEIAELSDLLGVSEMTVRRDLASLQADGAVRRVHGGALRASSGAYEPPYAVRSRLHRAAKQAIARAVVAGIDDGQTVVVDGGTSGVAVAELLADRVATVCPLSLRAAVVLAGSASVRLLVPGGFVRPAEQSFVGGETEHTLRQHVFDVYVMTVSGLSARAGLTEWNAEDVLIKQAALANSTRCVVACDSSKLGQSAFTRIATLAEVDLIVTDDGVEDEMRAQLLDSGTELLVVATTSGRDDADTAPVRRSPLTEEKLTS